MKKGVLHGRSDDGGQSMAEEPETEPPPYFFIRTDRYVHTRKAQKGKDMMTMHTEIFQRLDEINQLLYETGAEFRVVYEQIYKDGRYRDALVLKGESNYGSPVIYPDAAWWQRDNGEIVDMLQKVYTEGRKQLDGVDLEEMLSPDHIREAVLPRLVSGKAIPALQEAGIVCVPYLDMAIMFYIPVSHAGSFEQVSARITEVLLQEIGLSVMDICTAARENLSAQKMLFQPLTDVLSEMTGTACEGESALWLYTTENRMYGAAAMLHIEALKKAADQLQDDLLILPSSVHETLVLAYSGVRNDVSTLVDMVRAINGTHVQPEEVLSDNVYIYHRQDASLTSVL